ncbi:MAG: response regulator [Candidatus Eisenbacteria bacterium]|nr:response regulator [Candidatus Eisenbacteria bacterium]
MKRILIVDDDDQVRSMLRLTLERAGYEVEEAPDGRAAVACSARKPFDLVITDIIMPELEGFETIHKLRTAHPEVKIIAISGGGRLAPDGYLEVAGNLGAARSFVKPVDRDELLKAVHELTRAA